MLDQNCNPCRFKDVKDNEKGSNAHCFNFIEKPEGYCMLFIFSAKAKESIPENLDSIRIRELL